MNGTGYRQLTGFALALVALFGGAELLKGGFYLGKHEGDAIHLADIVLRMGSAGQWPHLDFMTPIGVLAAAPMALFVSFGFGIGHAILLGQILVALLVLLPAVWVAESRLSGYWRHVFVAYVIVLCLALVHGEANSAISISMHYNRWAWAVSYLVLLVTILPPLQPRHEKAEGVLIGLGMAALALIKMTYFVSLAPVVLVGLIARRLWGSLAAAALAGLAVVAVITALAGPDFWLAYLRDLLTVAQSTVRDRPGATFLTIVGGGAYIAPNLALIAIVIVLRQTGRATEGLLLFLLYVPFIYIVYQNYGNDPQWIVLALICAAALAPDNETARVYGFPASRLLLGAACVLVGVGVGSVQNMFSSPIRHFATPEEGVHPLLAEGGANADMLAQEARMFTPKMTENLDPEVFGFVAVADDDDEDEDDAKPAVLNGEVLRDCTFDGGFTAIFEKDAADLVAAGYSGKAILSADLFSPLWIYGDLAPVRGAAPWYYGALSGLANADFVRVPICPLNRGVRQQFLDAARDAGWSFVEVRRTPLYILMEANAPASDGNATSDK